MVDEKIYIATDGSEYILGSRVILNDIGFLLLFQKGTEEVSIAYEQNNELNFIDESYPNYSYIVNLLYEKVKNN